MNVLGVPVRLFRPAVEPEAGVTARAVLQFSTPRKPLPGTKMFAFGKPSSLLVGEGTRAPSRYRGLASPAPKPQLGLAAKSAIAPQVWPWFEFN